MSRKAETVYTSKMMNKAAREEKKAARNARRQATAFERFASENASSDVYYLNINGFAMPVRRSY